jgi:hypothetical protein
MRRLGILVAMLLLVACGGDGDEADPALFCQRLDRLTENDPFSAFGDSATSAEIEEGFRALVARADELVDVAPEDARAAARAFAESAASMQDVLDEAGFDPSALDARAYRDAQLTYAEASDRLLRYLESEC